MCTQDNIVAIFREYLPFEWVANVAQILHVVCQPDPSGINFTKNMQI